MNVAPQMPSKNNDMLLHPLERVNIFTKIQNVLGIKDYTVPTTSRECIRSVTPNFISDWRSKLNNFFGNDTAETAVA